MRFKTLTAWLKWQESCHPKPIDLGLERVKKVYQVLNPQRTKPFTIIVGGTNGKGSCIAMLNAIFRTEGYRVGAYMSPHLLNYNERIRINDEVVCDRMICEAFDRVDQARGQMTSLSYFEFGTLAALDIFARSELEVQLLEVGLGGRLDAVNIVDGDIVLITSIAIDHSEWLGGSRESIGLEKAGIFRSKVPAVIGDREPPNSLLDYADQNDAPLFRLGKDFDYQYTGRVWDWVGADNVIRDLPLPNLRGSQQMANAAVVMQTLELAKMERPVSKDSVTEALSHVFLPGRFQIVPAEKPEVLLDVAHNPQAARALADNLQRAFPGRRMHAVFSIMGDKDIEGVLFALKNVVDYWYISPLHMPRAASDSDIASAFGKCSILPFRSGFSDFQGAFEAAKQSCSGDDLIVIFGSFFLVEEYLARMSRC